MLAAERHCLYAETSRLRPAKPPHTFKKAVRWRGPAVMGGARLPRTAGGFKLIAAAKS